MENNRLRINLMYLDINNTTDILYSKATKCIAISRIKLQMDKLDFKLTNYPLAFRGGIEWQMAELCYK